MVRCADDCDSQTSTPGRWAACDVVTLGETMVLLWPTGAASLEDAATYAWPLGGAESNLAIALARIGLRPRWISRLGDDPFGRYTRATLERKERIAHGPRRVYYYRRGSAASRMAPSDLTPAQFAGARVRRSQRAAATLA